MSKTEGIYGRAPLFWSSDKIVIRDFLSKYMEKIRIGRNTTSVMDSLEAIGKLMEADPNMPQPAYFEDICSQEKLRTSDELKSFEVKLLKFKPYLFERMEVNPDSGLKTHKEILKSKDNTKRSKKLKYQDIWNIKERSQKINLKPGEEVLIAVRVFQPFMHRNVGRKNALPICTQEIHVLGQQTLCTLRDTIACISDGVLVKECSDTPNRSTVLVKNVYKSGFFFIDDTFFNDLRFPKNRDNSEVIRKWALDHGIAKLETKRMEETKFIDLSIHLGYPYVYQHQEGCEHLLVFSDVRLLDASDSLSSRAYPLIWCYKSPKIRICIFCKCSAEWLTRNNRRVPNYITYFCDACFKSYNYIDGKKIGDFEAYRFVNEVPVLF